MQLILRNIIRFSILVFLQITILNNVENMGFSNSHVLPQIYVLFIILLPFETPRWLSICIGFFIGIIIDYSLNTQGLHALASTTLGYLKPTLTKSLSPRDGYDFNSEPTLNDQGISWYLTYAAILIFIHHFCLFFFQKLSWGNFFDTFLTVFLSAAVTLLLSLLYQFIVYQKKK